MVLQQNSKLVDLLLEVSFGPTHPFLVCGIERISSFLHDNKKDSLH